MFSCEICAKVFSRVDNLKRHQKLHGVNEEQRFKTCNVADPEKVYDSVIDDKLVDTGSPGNIEFDCEDEDSPSRFFAKERSPLDIAMHSIMSNQELNTRNKLKGYFKVVGDHLRCKSVNCSLSKLGIDAKSNHSLKKVPNPHCKNISEENEENYYEQDDSEENEYGDEANKDIFEDTHDSSKEYNHSGSGTNQDIFGGTLVNSMECDSMEGDASEEESNCEDDNEPEDTDDDNIEDDVETENEESDEIKTDALEDEDNKEDYEISEGEDEVCEKVIINWPRYNIKKPWYSYGKEILLFDQLAWLQRMAASQSSLSLVKQIRQAEELQILALCEIALNLLMDHIPMTVKEFNCYRSQKDSLRELAYGDYDWKRKRLLLTSNNTLVWILLVSIESLYDSQEAENPKPKLKRNI